MFKKRQTRILILYAEVMEYLLTGIKQFKLDVPDSEILLFELNDRKLTSFTFQTSDFKHYKKTDFSSYQKFLNVCESFNPSVVLVSGRMNSHYLKLARNMKKKGVYTVTLQDTQYNRGIRQTIIRIFSKLLYKRNFCGFWGAGSLQTAFGLSLGFAPHDIFEGVYTANSNVFKYVEKEKENIKLGKTIIYVGRFSEEKNYKKLIEVFKKINLKYNQVHNLILIGAKEDQNYDSDNVKSYPFMSSNDLIELASEADIFCLPSKAEPWGVVVHEFSLLGLALLLSNRCGANSKFLINGFNGLSFDPFDDSDFEVKMTQMIEMDNLQLKLFGKRSRFLGNSINPDIWSATLQSIILKSTTIATW